MYGNTRLKTAKTPLRKKNKAGGIMLPKNFKLHYKATVIKKKLRYKNRHTDQTNRIKSLEMSPHLYGQLIYNKGAKNIQ